MVSTTFQAALLALLSLVTLASASGDIVTVALLFDLASPDADCAEYSDKLWRVSRYAMHNAGMDLQDDKEHWHGYLAIDEDNVEPEPIKEDVDAELYNHAYTGRRRLCNSFCQFMCISQGRYCSCCSCCGTGRRRNLRQLNQIELKDSDDIEHLKTRAAEEAIILLNSWHRHVPCLAEPYGVTVEVIKHGGDALTENEGNCQKTWEQCGGNNHMGPTCCEAGNECVYQDQWYSQCKPILDDGSGCQPAWEQCGGNGYSGETCCTAGTECKEVNDWFYQCQP